MKSSLKVILCYVLALVAIITVISLIYREVNQKEPPQYSDILVYFEKGYKDDDPDNRIKEYTINTKDVLTITFSDKSQVTYQLRDPSRFLEDISAFNEYVNQVNTDEDPDNDIKYNYPGVKTYSAWVYYLPWILLVIGIICLYFFAMKKMMNGGPAGKINSFGKSHARTPLPDDKNRVTFKDVAGADEEKEELEEIVEYLKNPTKFVGLGAKIPHGVLLVGPPGTGKTLLAKAVAGEAGVPFFSISGSDFVEMYVGVGASRVRDLFETARKANSSIIFIDEIDAVGRHRGAGLGGGHDEREQTLNQLLVEMDGFGSQEGIIVIAATNRPDILDPALLRPGRFDRQITVGIPDIRGREDILHVHAKNKPMEPDVDLGQIARTTAGFTGADLANLLNEAALLAARRHKSLIGMEDIEDAFIKVIAGPKKRSRVMNEREKKNTAYHEAGHAMVAYLLDLDPVQQISIIPSGRALGYTLNPPKEDKYSVYKESLKKEISMLLGGRAAEEIIFGDVSGGASNDIQRATNIAKEMVTRLGMSELLGPRQFGTDQSEVFLGRSFSSTADYSEEVAARIDSEIHDLISNAYEKAKELLRANEQKLHFLAAFLLKHELMDGEQFRLAMEKDDVTDEDLEAVAAEKKRKSHEANEARARQLAEEAEAKAAEEAAANETDIDADTDSDDGYVPADLDLPLEENLDEENADTDETQSAYPEANE